MAFPGSSKRSLRAPRSLLFALYYIVHLRVGCSARCIAAEKAHLYPRNVRNSAGCIPHASRKAGSRRLQNSPNPTDRFKIMAAAQPPRGGYTVACIQNFNCAVLIFPCASKYQFSQSSGLVFRLASRLVPSFTVQRHEKWSYTSSTCVA